MRKGTAYCVGYAAPFLEENEYEVKNLCLSGKFAQFFAFGSIIRCFVDDGRPDDGGASFFCTLFPVIHPFAGAPAIRTEEADFLAFNWERDLQRMVRQSSLPILQHPWPGSRAK